MSFFVQQLAETTVSETVSQAATTNIDSITSVGEMTDGITSIAKAISDYGPVIVVMAIFFVLFLGLVILVLRNNSKLMNQMVKRQETYDKTDQQIINKFVENALAAHDSKNEEEIKHIISEFKESLEPLENAMKSLNDENGHRNSSKDDDSDDYHKDLVGAFIDVNMAFKDASRTALNKLKCERIAIYVFHNGNSSIHGLPFFKMSCIHEWTSRGSNTLRGKYHVDIPLHLFNDFIEDLWKDGVYKSSNIEVSEDEDQSISEFIAFSNAKALYMIGITDSESKLAGFVVAEFAETDTFDVDKERDKFVSDTLNEMVAKVAPIIANHYVYKKAKKESK